MPSTARQPDTEQIARLLIEWITRHGSADGIEWLIQRRDEIESGAPSWKFFTSFSAVPRYLGKRDLDLNGEDLRMADSLRNGWSPAAWSVDQAGRTLLVLSLPADDHEGYSSVLDQVFSTADVRESVALYQALPLLPHPLLHVGRASEGVRSNMTSVFNAVALENPFPSEFLDEAAWNQMVLKAIFVGSPLSRIIGIDERGNRNLARMLVDYAHERWAAGRSVTPELWRPVGPFAGEFLSELTRVFGESDDVQQQAAALSLSASNSPDAHELLNKYPDLRDRIRSGELSWDAVSST